jgi:OmpA-OmpF porin, OOP family
MKSKKALIAALIGVSAAVAAPVAFAQARGQAADAGGYVGGSFGQSTASCDVGGVGLSCDDKDTAWKVFGGYQINRNFAVELGYANLGEISITGGATRITVETTAWDLVGVGIFPINNQFSIYGKLGVYRATVDVSSNVGGSGDDSANGLTLGAGVRYNFTRNLGLQAEWQRYQSIDAPGGSVLTGSSDTDVLSLGVVYKF